jgi:hypothetical protein
MTINNQTYDKPKQAIKAPLSVFSPYARGFESLFLYEINDLNTSELRLNEVVIIKTMTTS